MPIFHQYNRIPSIQVLSRVLIGILSLMEIEAFIEKKEPPPKQLIDGLRDIHGNIYAWKGKECWRCIRIPEPRPSNYFKQSIREYSRKASPVS